MASKGQTIQMSDQEGTYEISLLEMDFAKAYVSNGYNATKAYAATHPDATPASCNTNGCKWARREHVVRYIEQLRKEAFDSLHIDAYRVLEELAEIGFAPKGDEDYNTTCKIKALELLGKHLQLFEGKKEEAIEQVIRVSIEGE